MAISAAARANHGLLFPGHVSTLAVTDPELIEVFDNFAFDEVLHLAPLDTRIRLITQLGALIAAGALGEYRMLVGAAVEVGITPVEVKEIVYQAVPYVGMGRVYDFLHATNDILAARGVALPLEGQSTTTTETRYDRGLAVQTEIIGADRVGRLHATAEPDQRHIQHLLSANCFGDHVARAGLDIPTRELLTFSMLVALGGCEPQAAGHVTANLRVGNDRSLLVAVATQLLPFIGYPRTLNALRVISHNAPLPTSTQETPS
jgi:4-carboxymuconolactone decarboxylase